jgi:hypothetical protein
MVIGAVTPMTVFFLSDSFSTLAASMMLAEVQRTEGTGPL